MLRHAAPQFDVPHRYPSGFWRMSDYTCHHAAASRQPATLAATERVLAEFAVHNHDSAIRQNFQRMLRVTMGDWKRTDSIAADAKVVRR